MSLTRLRVQNYRSFPDLVDLELRPITLVYGENNSGKSALLRLLPTLACSADADIGQPLSIGSPATRNASFQELLCSLTAKPSLTLGLSGLSGVDAQFTIRDLSDRRRQVVEEFRLCYEGREWRFSWQPTDELDEPFLSYQLAGSTTTHHLQFRGLLPYEKTDSDAPIVQARAMMKGLAHQVQWLSSLRATPERLFLYGARPRTLGPAGEGTAELIAYDHFDGGPILPQVNRWYRSHLGSVLEARESGESFSLNFGPADVPDVRTNLTDTGEGVAQVLPVLVAGARAAASSGPVILALEQPELHLHPEIHGALMQYLANAAAENSAARIVIETHSKSVLHQTQIEILDGSLSPDDVIIYWVRQDAVGRSSVARVVLDERARPSDNWPPGALMQDVEEARAIFEKRSRLEDER